MSRSINQSTNQAKLTRRARATEASISTTQGRTETNQRLYFEVRRRVCAFFSMRGATEKSKRHKSERPENENHRRKKTSSTKKTKSKHTLVAFVHAARCGLRFGKNTNKTDDYRTDTHHATYIHTSLSLLALPVTKVTGFASSDRTGLPAPPPLPRVEQPSWK